MTRAQDWIELGMGDHGPDMRGTACWASSPAPGADGNALWAWWKWDGTRLQAQVDPQGFYSLFCYCKGDRVALSPSLLQLVAAGCDAAPDRAALAVFHRLGLFVEDTTPLSHVRTLPPGGRLCWSRGKLTITGGGPEAPQVRQISRKEAVDGLITHFRASVARILEHWPGRMCLPLTGGRDSRHILLEMLRQGRRPEACVTVHQNGKVLPPEALGARAICARHGLALDILGHPRPRVADIARTLVMTGLCADEHAQMMPLHDYFAAHGGAAIDGIAGNTLTEADTEAETALRLAEAGDFETIAQNLIDGHAAVISQPGWGRGAGPIHSPGQDDEARALIAAAIARGVDAPNPLQMFRWRHRMRREISFVPRAILSSAERVFSAYLDPDLVAFCLSLPLSVTRDGQLHNEAIARAFPQDVDVPFQDGFGVHGWQPGGLAHKLRSLRAIWRVGRALGLDPRQMRALATPPARLRPGTAQTYLLHALCLDGLDGTRARRLLALEKTLCARPPAALVSERFRPGADGGRS